MIRNIIFDLGGVLLNIDINRTLSALKELGFPPEELAFGLGHAEGLFKQYEAGQMSDSEFVEGIRARLGHAANERQVVEAWNALLLDFPSERIRWVETLRPKYRLFLFSNTNNLHLEAFQQKYLAQYGHPFDELFERAYYSHIVGIRKPDVEAYRTVIRENQLVAGETLFVDDAVINLEGARAAGLETFHVGPGRTVLDIEVEG